MDGTMTSPAEPETEEQRGHHAVLEALGRRIVAHDLLPGARLREQTLSEEFGVSRARIREVLAALEERGLVEREPNRGAVVRRQTAAELLHVFDVREVLEGLCARQATENAPPDSWQDLVELFGTPTAALLEAGDIAGYLHHHETLRQRMLTACANPVLVDMLRPLHERVGFIMRRLVLTTNRADEALAEHRAVLAAMRAGDAEAAERCKRRQIRSARNALERYQQFLL